jgi:hypothetical protein
MREERRKYPRSKPPVEFVFSCVTAEFARGGDNLALRFIDMSPKGALIVTTGRLRPGAALQFRIESQKSRALFRGKAVVRWAETWVREGREANVAGVEFMEAEELRGEEMRYFMPWIRDKSRFVETRREHGRFTPPACDAGCFPKGFLGFSSKNVARRLVDLSEGGVQLDCEEKIEPGKSVKVQLRFRSPAQLLEAVGEVRWCRRNTLVLEPHWMTGIRFTEVADDHAVRLREMARVFVIGGAGRSIEEGPPPGL